jgi:hypothetical protein
MDTAFLQELLEELQDVRATLESLEEKINDMLELE